MTDLAADAAPQGNMDVPSASAPSAAAAAASASVSAGAGVLVEMQGVLDRIPEPISLYRHELEKLVTACSKSLESEQRLVVRTKEIVAEIQSSHEALLRDEEEESDALAQRKKARLECDAVVAQIAASVQMEADKQRKLNDLRTNLALLQEQVAKLSMPLGLGSNGETTGDVLLSEEQELRVANLKKQRADGARDVEAKTTTLQDLRVETASLSALVQEEEAKNAQLADAHAHATALIQEKQCATDKQVRRKAALEKELKMLNQRLELLQGDADMQDATKTENEDALRDKEIALRGSKLEMEKYLKQYDTLFRTTHQLTADMQAQWQKNVELHKLNVQVEQDLQVQENQIQQAARDALKLEKLIELAKEQLAEVETKRLECEQDRDKLRLQLHDLLNGSMEKERKQSELLRQQLDERLREREVLNKMLVQANDRAQAAFDVRKIKENTLKNLQNEVNGLKAHVKALRAQLQQLVCERDKYEKEAGAATQQLITSLEESKLQDLQVTSLQQKIIESENRLKQQQNLYEAVRTDRNLYSKQLMERQEEISEMRRKFKILSHQIEQLKEEITVKDHALVKEHFDHHKVDKEKEILKNELQRLKKQIQSSEQILSNQELEATKLAKIIQEADEEKQRQQKEYASVVHDRDMLRQQLVQRNDELRVLYEKLKIQRSTLTKGQRQFEQRCEQVQELHTRIHALQFESDSSRGQLQHEDTLKRELLQLEKELLQEQTKIRVLSEELDHPLNVHRWRRLESGDPKCFDMIRKLQVLQRKLIKKTEEAMVKDLVILEKEKLYVELKTILARQPGAEVAEQLVVYKDTLKTKQQQMLHMQDELELYKLQVNEYRREQDALEAERKRIQQTWLQQQIHVLSAGRGSNQLAENAAGV